MILNENMRKRRRGLDLTQKEVARRCIITQSYYTQIERGRATPSVEVLCSIAKVLGLQFADIVEV